MACNTYVAGLLCIFNVSAAIAGTMEDIKARGELVAGVKADYPPYGFHNPDGQIAGLEPDLAADLAKRLGVSLKLIAVLSSNRIEYLQSGKIDIILATLSITDERRKKAGFIDPPYYAAGAGLLAHNGVHVDEATQLVDRSICAVKGNIYWLELHTRVPEAKALVFSDVPSAERALLDGQCEALLFNDNLLLYKKQSEPDRFKDYHVLQLIDIDPLPWGIAVKRGEEQLAFGQLVSQAIIDWHRSGFLLNLERKWLGANTALLQALNVKWVAATAHTQKAGFGTPAEARAMLGKVVAGMQADQEKTLAQIRRGEFKDRDLYPYCIGPKGKYVAHPDPSRVGLVYKEVRDKAGKAYGKEVSRRAVEGQIGEVHYVFPRPTTGIPTPKVGLFTKVAGHICVVGYYKPHGDAREAVTRP